MGLTAISLDPSNVGYRINVANLLMAMDKSDSALQVLQAASKVAQTPEDSKMVADALTRAHEYMDAQAQISAQQSAGDGSINSRETTDANKPTLKRRDFVPKGPHRFALGTLKKVICENPGMDLTVVVNGKTLPLHADNYFKIPFSALGFHPSSDLNPCADLENRPAKVEYVESANPSVSAQLISVELHK